ncbi:MAG: hypothetical protein GY710_14365, partial [Desulfobacteraceae bacterium]|nr:hypothetical protein [Desulfobacteraceae bacterium]
IQGRPDHPVIQHVYPMGLSLPEVPDNMGRWQQRPGVHQTVDPQGHWERKTDKDIKDIAQNIQETAAGSHTRTIEKDSIKSVGGNCTTTISGNSNKTIKGNSNEAVTGPKTVTTSSFKISSPTVVIGAPGDGPSLLPLISKALTDIKDALDILANHTHPNVGTSPSGPDVAEKASGVGGVNSSLESLQE